MNEKEKYFLIPRFNEFNTLPMYNFWVKTIKEKNPNCEFHVILPKDYIVIFDCFDFIYEYPINFTSQDYFENRQKYGHEGLSYNETNIKLKFDDYYNFCLDFFKQMNIIEHPDLKVSEKCEYQNLLMPIESAPYYYLFPESTKYLINNEVPLIKPIKSDYVKIKNEIIKLYGGKKIVTINGRIHPSKGDNRNQNLINYIKKLLDDNFFVINTTVIKPNFYFGPYYLEPNNCENFSYSENLCYFLLSDFVISVSNCGAINCHLMTQSNIILVPNNESWIDSNSFGFDGKTMVTARKINNLITEYSTIENLSNFYNLVKIEENNIFFFDTTKIIKLNKIT